VEAAEAAEEARLARRALTSAGTDAGAVPPQARRRSIVACLSFRGPVPAALQMGYLPDCPRGDWWALSLAAPQAAAVS